MNLNQLAINTISSDYIKNYLTKVNHKFTLEEQITIIFNSELDFNAKIELYNKYLSQIKDEELKIKIESITCNMEVILDALNGLVPDYVLLYEDEWDTKACRNIKDLRTNISCNIDSTLCINICDLNTSKIVVSVIVNKEYTPIHYELPDESKWVYSGLGDLYVNIPNDIHVGDIVSIHGDEIGTEYIVIGDSDIPKELIDNCCYTVDVGVAIIPKDVIQKDDRTYREIIESIIKNRIYYVGDDKYNDVVAKHEEHIHLTLVEKISM